MSDIIGAATLALISDWATTLTLIFGGCCSNALTLEQLTSQHPNAGSLITFAQFLLITVNGLRKFVAWTPYPHLKPRRIPLLPYIVQVVLFYAVSYINNAAFAYRIPMTVHIIFRSGGLAISMLMGWLLQGKKYKYAQVASVGLVTAGVVITTLSASKPKPARSTTSDFTSNSEHTRTYLTGIALLTLALVLSGLLGIAQDKTYATYVRPFSAKNSSKAAEEPRPRQKKRQTTEKAEVEPWQESMFYLHFLSLPMFVLARNNLSTQLSALNAGPALELPESLQASFDTFAQPTLQLFGTERKPGASWSFRIPAAYLPLLLNTLTQLVCVSGVHRLTSRVSSLTVTLVLVVRKAVSLIISVLLFNRSSGSEEDKARMLLMWGGAACVFVGTMLYSVASSQAGTAEAKGAKEKNE